MVNYEQLFNCSYCCRPASRAMPVRGSSSRCEAMPCGLKFEVVRATNYCFDWMPNEASFKSRNATWLRPLICVRSVSSPRENRASMMRRNTNEYFALNNDEPRPGGRGMCREGWQGGANSHNALYPDHSVGNLFSREGLRL